MKTNITYPFHSIQSKILMDIQLFCFDIKLTFYVVLLLSHRY